MTRDQEVALAKVAVVASLNDLGRAFEHDGLTEMADLMARLIAVAEGTHKVVRLSDSAAARRN